LVLNLRKSNSNYGGRKLHFLLKQEMELREIKMGRDKFFTFLRHNKLLVKRHKSYHITTDSNHRFYKYPNIIKNYVPGRPEQIWVSDITYIKTENGHLNELWVTL
jgi:transposase InsO family protein